MAQPRDGEPFQEVRSIPLRLFRIRKLDLEGRYCREGALPRQGRAGKRMKTAYQVAVAAVQSQNAELRRAGAPGHQFDTCFIKFRPAKAKSANAQRAKVVEKRRRNEGANISGLGLQGAEAKFNELRRLQLAESLTILAAQIGAINAKAAQARELRSPLQGQDLPVRKIAQRQCVQIDHSCQMPHPGFAALLAEARVQLLELAKPGRGQQTSNRHRGARHVAICWQIQAAQTLKCGFCKCQRIAGFYPS